MVASTLRALSNRRLSPYQLGCLLQKHIGDGSNELHCQQAYEALQRLRDPRIEQVVSTTAACFPVPEFPYSDVMKSIIGLLKGEGWENIELLQPSYDKPSGIVRYQARFQEKDFKCGIDLDALLDGFHTRCDRASPASTIAAFEASRDEIGGVTKLKILDEAFEADGTILIRSTNVVNPGTRIRVD